MVRFTPTRRLPYARERERETSQLVGPSDAHSSTLLYGRVKVVNQWQAFRWVLRRLQTENIMGVRAHRILHCKATEHGWVRERRLCIEPIRALNQY